MCLIRRCHTVMKFDLWHSFGQWFFQTFNQQKRYNLTYFFLFDQEHFNDISCCYVIWLICSRFFPLKGVVFNYKLMQYWKVDFQRSESAVCDAQGECINLTLLNIYWTVLPTMFKLIESRLLYIYLNVKTIPSSLFSQWEGHTFTIQKGIQIIRVVSVSSVSTELCINISRQFPITLVKVITPWQIYSCMSRSILLSLTPVYNEFVTDHNQGIITLKAHPWRSQILTTLTVPQCFRRNTLHIFKHIWYSLKDLFWREVVGERCGRDSLTRIHSLYNHFYQF